MNLRRTGKLKGDGRARIWLGARREQVGNSSIVSEAGQGIADGGKGQGAVVLDGEVGEAREIDSEEERVHREASKDRRRLVAGALKREKSVPSRWVSYVP